MKLTGLEYKPFVIRLKTPFINSSSAFTSRHGYIISISDELNHISMGEVSPLPGFSSESLNRAESELKQASELAAGFEEAKDLDVLKRFFMDINFTTSVSFGIEQAMIGLLLQRIPSLLDQYVKEPAYSVPVNAVIDLSGGAVDEIELKVKKGFTTFKIKAGRDNFNEDLNIVKDIRSRFGYDLNLRLDVNGKWNDEDALDNLISLEPYKIEYVEEPVHGINELISLSKKSPVPIAVDESVKTITEAENIINNSSINYLVIKPMVLGAFFGTLDLISLAAKKGKSIIISSSFESPLGKSLLVLLAASAGSNYAHGLDTADFFENPLFEDPYQVENGYINFIPQNYPLLYKEAIK